MEFATSASMDNYADSCVFMSRTVQVGPLKTMVSSLKEIIMDTNITITPMGISIVNMDKTNKLVVKAFLEANKFQKYVCKKPKIVISANMSVFNMWMEFINPTDVCILSIENSNYKEGIIRYLTITGINSTSSKITRFQMKLIEPETEDLEYPILEFTTEAAMKSAVVSKIIRGYNGVSAHIEIKSVGNDMAFSCAGEQGIADIVFTDAASELDDVSSSSATDTLSKDKDLEIKFKKKPTDGKIVQGIFVLRYMMIIAKFSGLSKEMELYLENDLPLMVKFSVADLGYVYLCLRQYEPTNNMD